MSGLRVSRDLNLRLRISSTGKVDTCRADRFAGVIPPRDHYVFKPKHPPFVGIF